MPLEAFVIQRCLSFVPLQGPKKERGGKSEFCRRVPMGDAPRLQPSQTSLFSFPCYPPRLDSFFAPPVVFPQLSEGLKLPWELEEEEAVAAAAEGAAGPAGGVRAPAEFESAATKENGSR